MKLVTYKNGFKSRIGIIDGENVIDIKSAYEFITAHTPQQSRIPIPYDMVSFLSLGDEGLITAQKLHESIKKNPPLSDEIIIPLNKVKLQAPIPKPGKIICVGLNYLNHIKEGNSSIPKEPVLFGKYANAVIGPDEAIRIPSVSNQIDYEAELAFVIGKSAYRVDKLSAMDYVAGYVNFNDVSARDLQLRDGQWMKGKFLDTFTPKVRISSAVLNAAFSLRL
jgi:acylpyruvate hydrolase